MTTSSDVSNSAAVCCITICLYVILTSINQLKCIWVFVPRIRVVRILSHIVHCSSKYFIYLSYQKSSCCFHSCQHAQEPTLHVTAVQKKKKTEKEMSGDRNQALREIPWGELPVRSPCSTAAIKSGWLQEETGNFICVNISQISGISTSCCCCLPNRELSSSWKRVALEHKRQNKQRESKQRPFFLKRCAWAQNIFNRILSKTCKKKENGLRTVMHECTILLGIL